MQLVVDSCMCLERRSSLQCWCIGTVLCQLSYPARAQLSVFKWVTPGPAHTYCIPSNTIDSIKQNALGLDTHLFGVEVSGRKVVKWNEGKQSLYGNISLCFLYLSNKFFYYKVLGLYKTFIFSKRFHRYPIWNTY